MPPHIIDTSLQSARPDSDEGDKFNNSDTASEDGELSDADGEASDKSKHSTEELSSGSSGYNTPTKKRKLSKTDRVEKTVQDIVSCIIKKQREEEDKYLHIEERRLELEEKMAERESQHRKDMLEFQKQMFSSLAGMMSCQTRLPQQQQHPMYPLMPLQEAPAHQSYHGQYYHGPSDYSQD